MASPYFFTKKNWRPFWVIASGKWWPFLAVVSSSSSHVVYPVFFLNSATKINFSRVSPPGGGYPGRSAPPPVTPLVMMTLTVAYTRCLPVLFAFQQFAVGGDLHLKTHLGVHDGLQLSHDRIHLRLESVRFSLEWRILSLQFTLSSLLAASQRRDLARKLRVLQVIALITKLKKTRSGHYPVMMMIIISSYCYHHHYHHYSGQPRARRGFEIDPTFKQFYN